ncbi:MAG TPA: hypothetical protein VEP67_06415 [Thiobacillaceae bacterium]|nr:hypothetical protein [Thiobacillaceae bacterium]
MTASFASWALGLGELTLESYLGQPLKASVALLAEPDETIDETCFQARSANVGGVPGVAEINIVLQRHKGGARLLLTSRHPVNEPAVGISVITDCPQRLGRQYMVLLDPPTLMDTVALPKTLAQATSTPVTPAPHRAHPTRTAYHRPASRPGIKTARTHAHRVAHPRMVSSLGPRLILSGRNHAAAGAPSFDASPSAPGKYKDSPPVGREVPDEGASLNRKLAHLEQQLADLQRLNAELDLAARKAPAPAKPAATSDNPWLPWFAGPGLLMVGALLAWRWRSMRKPRLQFRQTDLWSAPVEQTKAAIQPEPFAEDVEAHPLQDVGLADEPPPEHPAAPEPSAPSPPARTPVVAKWADGNRNGVEVDDSMVDEVEVFVAHGHADLAINLLEEHLRVAPDESPIPWMLLLDLLKRQKLAKEYEKTRKACKLHFNIRVPDLDEDEPGSEAAGLEGYPHILAELIRLWGTPKCQTYLDDLIFDRRGGTRAGFESPAYREIMLLRILQGEETPLVAARYRSF